MLTLIHMCWSVWKCSGFKICCWDKTNEHCANKNELSVLPLEIGCLINKYIDCNLPSERPDRRRRPSGGREFSHAARASSRAAYHVRTRYVFFLFLFLFYFYFLFIYFFLLYAILYYSFYFILFLSFIFSFLFFSFLSFFLLSFMSFVQTWFCFFFLLCF
jgi:hypothetical protein